MPAASHSSGFCLRITSLLAALAILCLSAAEVSAQVSIVVQSVDGSSKFGRLEQLSAKQLFVRSGTDLESLGVDKVLRLTMTPEQKSSSTAADLPATPVPSATPWLLTSTGDWLRVQPLMIDDESIVARWSHFPDQPPLTVPLEVCRGTVLKLSNDSYRQGIEFSSLLDDEQSTDRIVLQNGDRLAGELSGLADGKLQLDTPLGITTVSPDNVRSIVFNPELISTPEAPPAHLRVVLRDGSLLCLRTALSNGGVLLGETLADSAVSLPLEHVADVWFLDADRVSVSSLPVTDTKLTPYLSVKRSPQFDRNVLGGPLRVRGVSVASGIGVSSGSTVTFALDGQFKTLLGRVSLDDAAESLGSVRFEIVGDGELLWQSSVVTVATGPVELPRLDVSYVAQLSLKVGVADRGPVRDIADWCDLILLK